MAASTQRIAFIKTGGFSHINDRVAAMLRTRFPDAEIDVVEVLRAHLMQHTPERRAPVLLFDELHRGRREPVLQVLRVRRQPVQRCAVGHDAIELVAFRQRRLATREARWNLDLRERQIDLAGRLADRAIDSDVARQRAAGDIAAADHRDEILRVRIGLLIEPALDHWPGGFERIRASPP